MTDPWATIIAALVTSVIGGVLVALVNQFFGRKRTDAEVAKLLAETEKLRAETEAQRLENEKLRREWSQVTAALRSFTADAVIVRDQARAEIVDPEK